MPDSQGAHDSLLEQLRRSGHEVHSAASLVAPWQHVKPEGEWSAHEHLFHLVANEAIFQERVRLAVAEPHPAFQRWDSGGHMAGHYRTDDDIELLAERFGGARSETADLLTALGSSQWRRTFVWPDGVTRDLEWLAEKVLWHAMDHFATLLDYHGEFQPLQADHSR